MRAYTQDQKGLNKLKGAADVIKVKNMMEKMQAQVRPQPSDPKYCRSEG